MNATSRLRFPAACTSAAGLTARGSPDMSAISPLHGVTSPCSAPAPVLGTYSPAAPGYIVQFHDGIDPSAETARLAQRYGFMPTHVFRVIPGFSALLSEAHVRALRCEASVELIEHDAVVRPG